MILQTPVTLGYFWDMKYIEEIFVRSSINIILTEPGKRIPVDYGTVCIVEYRGRNFLLSVSHVIKKGLDVYIEPNQADDGKTTPIIPIHGILSYTYLNFDETGPEEISERIEEGGIAIDFSVAEIKTPIEILQNDIKFPSFAISGGSKLFPKLEYAVDPNPSAVYGFFGYINQDMNGAYLQRQPEFKSPLKFHKNDREFLVFKAKKQIAKR